MILKNISLLDRIWSLWLVRFAHSPTNFIFWLGSLIFSVSINSHPDNIYVLSNTLLIFSSLFICLVYFSIFQRGPRCYAILKTRCHLCNYWSFCKFPFNRLRIFYLCRIAPAIIHIVVSVVLADIYRTYLMVFLGKYFQLFGIHCVLERKVRVHIYKLYTIILIILILSSIVVCSWL